MASRQIDLHAQALDPVFLFDRGRECFQGVLRDVQHDDIQAFRSDMAGIGFTNALRAAGHQSPGTVPLGKIGHADDLRFGCTDALTGNDIL